MRKLIERVLVIGLILSLTGCVGAWDATIKTLDATVAIIDCADGGEYEQDKAVE